MQYQYILAFILLFALKFDAFAQPDQKEHKGCHHVHNLVPMLPLTDDEKALMVASAERSDTIDIINYNITLEVLDVNSRYVNGNCEVSFASKMDDIDHIDLDLLEFTIDSITSDGQQLTYDYDGVLLHVNLPTVLNTGDEATVKVFYKGAPVVSPGSFGGLDFRSGYAYNLGIGLGSNPYNYGRGWFPCFDNFVERSTYDYNILSTLPDKAYCVGTFMGETSMGDDIVMRSFTMNQQIPTYLSAIAVSEYVEVNDVHTGQYGDIPTQLLAKPNDAETIKNTFVDLGDAIDALEYWYGPYQWERVGYVTTIVGAMEHPTNIAYPEATILDGNSAGHKRLMSHELAHCWWGNVVTLSSPANMWIKEGNAEYGAHLMTEYAEDNEAFLRQVKENFYTNVLKSAHEDDDGYWQLSGIPFEHTYGTHTYRKGASMIHNMRGYLGDSLFRMGQRSVLETFAFDAINAEQYRDQLISATGYDMTSYFDDWIYNPGYSAFDTKHSYTANGDDTYDIDITIFQGLHNAPNLHTNVPLEITIVGANGEKYMERLMGQNESASYTITSPVEPSFITVNENHALNMAHFSDQKTITETDDFNMAYTEMSISVQEVSSPAILHVDHYWIAPDPIQNNPNNALISNTHFWRIEGTFPEGFNTRANTEYGNYFDSALLTEGEEDLILIYRRNKDFDWEEYPFYTKIIANPTDNNGFISIQQVLPGEYTFAKGELPLFTSNKDVVVEENNLLVYPNPSSDRIQIQQKIEDLQKVQVQLFNVEGKLLLNETVNVFNNNIDYSANVAKYPSGTYWLRIIDSARKIHGLQAVEIVH